MIVSRFLSFSLSFLSSVRTISRIRSIGICSLDLVSVLFRAGVFSLFSVFDSVCAVYGHMVFLSVRGFCFTGRLIVGFTPFLILFFVFTAGDL